MPWRVVLISLMLIEGAQSQGCNLNRAKFAAKSEVLCSSGQDVYACPNSQAMCSEACEYDSRFLWDGAVRGVQADHGADYLMNNGQDLTIELFYNPPVLFCSVGVIVYDQSIFNVTFRAYLNGAVWGSSTVHENGTRVRPAVKWVRRRGGWTDKVEAVFTSTAAVNGTLWGLAELKFMVDYQSVYNGPTRGPSAATLRPSAAPSTAPSASPSFAPSLQPSLQPSTQSPTSSPSARPSTSPSDAPTVAPSVSPSLQPSLRPSTRSPTVPPSPGPMAAPSVAPTLAPSVPPSFPPSLRPSTLPPTLPPSLGPSALPSVSPILPPSVPPSFPPNLSPSIQPSAVPSDAPTIAPSFQPSRPPTSGPSPSPSSGPSAGPSTTPLLPSRPLSAVPTSRPSGAPATSAPSWSPSAAPTGCRCVHGRCIIGDEGDVACVCDTAVGRWAGETCAECEAGWHGPACAMQCPGGHCRPCSGHGTCSDGADGDGACSCDVGWGGHACGGCARGWAGVGCDVRCPDCGPNGRCEQEGECACDVGWQGPSCSERVPDCIDSCSGYGVCVGGVCDCDGTHWGIACEIPCVHCFGGVCSSTGSCQCAAGLDPTQNCTACLLGSWGVDCSDACPDCGARALPGCSRSLGECLCSAGWAGVLCSEACTGPPRCSGHGQC
eukprot:Hpha_TRINITY_DN9739_c0_g1::TRINITY_DN9739_c0_g1_i3::g.10206::m.10206